MDLRPIDCLADLFGYRDSLPPGEDRDGIQDVIEWLGSLARFDLHPYTLPVTRRSNIPLLAIEFANPDRPCPECGDIAEDDPALRWIHRNHRIYNRVARDLLVLRFGLAHLREELATAIRLKDGPSAELQAILDHVFVEIPDWC